MSKIVVDAIQKSGGVALTLPTADGNSGETLQTDGSGQLSFVAPEVVQTTKYSKAFAVTGSSAAASNKIMWTDVKPGIATDDILFVRIEGKMASTNPFKIRLQGADAAGDPITTGYLGSGYNDYYNGSTESNSSANNSNQGWLDFPGYTTAYGSSSDSYGYGIAFVYEACLHKYGATGGHHHMIKYWYQQSTSYNQPNFGTTVWNNYATSTPPETWHGVHIYPTAGSWDTNYSNNVISVELVTNNA